ncbi:hypothetical protein, partial [Corynebacterium incognita]|uniref:hypothetical protein n=1 Tax=Corynebacterium incognita TaxID=2754725 RepID=UPI001BA9D897
TTKTDPNPTGQNEARNIITHKCKSVITMQPMKHLNVYSNALIKKRHPAHTTTTNTPCATTQKIKKYIGTLLSSQTTSAHDIR